MRNPAEVFASQKFEAGLPKRCGVFLERWKVALFLTFCPVAKLVLQSAAKGRETVVHIDCYTNASRRKKAQNITDAVQLVLSPMAVADGVYTDNEVERVFQFGRLLP
jgi:hypothetical protein